MKEYMGPYITWGYCKYLGPYIETNYGGGINYARFDARGRPTLTIWKIEQKWHVPVYDPNINKYERYNSLQEAMNAYDKCLMQQGFTILDQDKFEKIRILA